MLKLKSKVLFILLIFTFNVKGETIDLPPLKDITPFTDLEATVGYIQKENGEKFLVVETPEGTKLVKVKENPKKLIEKQIK